MFPFVHPVAPSSQAVISVYRPAVEPTLGLIFALPMFLLAVLTICFLTLKGHIKMNAAKKYKLPLLLFMSGISVMFLEAFFGFIVYRYVLDACPFFLIGSMLFIFSISEKYIIKPYIKCSMVAILLIQSLVFCVLPAFYGNFDVFVKSGNPEFIQAIRNSFSLY